ncbi:hypothetical protein GUJ93_ZPchr0013g33875 [Zizania palustris]|uniref:DUF1677 family protein n=1 Tax=Zizania palustris TaxID=103762 RepID=A0A8J5WWU0_ZIZPA|nr:hypothetical protein GUJ93_ZPchr0013g37400 [Zizania palustris]KAG8097101.1 hypothetical protein GUJ93_ZPchr0013g33875 [Zizania palustris]
MRRLTASKGGDAAAQSGGTGPAALAPGQGGALTHHAALAQGGVGASNSPDQGDAVRAHGVGQDGQADAGQACSLMTASFSSGESLRSAAASGQEVNPVIAVAAAAPAEVEWADCACCGLREECTPTYAAGVRAQYGGRWLCGLCGEVVGEELSAGAGWFMVEVELVIARHAAFCRAIGCRSPAAAERLIAAVRRLLRARESGRKKEKAVVVLDFHDA